jgi:hypothetical protein
MSTLVISVLVGTSFLAGVLVASRKVNSATMPRASDLRVSAHAGLLRSLEGDLERDIAEWEAVLSDFPQVVFPEDDSAVDERPSRAMRSKSSQASRIADDQSSSPNRSRRPSKDERSLIVRLTNSGFAPEEIALCLDLAFERVQEVLNGR